MPERLPDVAKSGKLIEVVDPQPDVRKNAETASDWEFKDQAAFLYRWAMIFKDRLLDPVLLTDRKRLPDPVISFENLRNLNILAAYRLHRNPQGLLYEVTFNTVHIVNGKWVFGEWGELETLLHEQAHLWQQNFGKEPVNRNYHNSEFVEKCESLGIHPKIDQGYHTRRADGVFAQLMKEHGIQKPDVEAFPTGINFDWWKLLDGGKRRGTSTLIKYTCPACGLNVRLGIKADPKLVHEPCSQVLGEKVFLVRNDGLTHTLFDNETDNPKEQG